MYTIPLSSIKYKQFEYVVIFRFNIVIKQQYKLRVY